MAARFGEYTAPQFRRERIVRTRPSLKHLGHLKRLLPYMARYRLWITTGIVGLLFSRFFEATVPLFIKSAVDSLALGVPNLALPVAGILAMTAARFIFSSFSNRLIRRVAISTAYDLRRQYFDHVQQMGPTFFAEFSTGETMSRASGDIAMVRRVVAFGWAQVMMFSFSLITGLAFMFYLSPSLTLFALLPTPLVAIVGVTMSRRLFPMVREQRQAMGDVNSFTQENLNGIRTVQAMAQEHREIERFEQISTRYASLVYRTTKYRALMNLTMPFVSIFSTLIVLGYGGHLVLQNDISIGTFTAFFSYMVMVTGPVRSLGGLLSMFTSAAAGTERLFEVLDTPTETPEAPDPVTADRIHGAIEFKNFSYHYPGSDEQVLSHIDMRIEPGEMVAILGPVGAGKSTLLKSLVRLVEPGEAEVLIDGVDVRRYPLAQLRRDVAFIPQDPFLFSVTIRDNITYDEPDRVMEPVEEAARMAELLETIDAFPERMDTVVGERGITLSGGQKQRATLARGLIREAPILAMDDCFSSVDTRTEESILGRLKRVRTGRTTLLISHRVSTARHADRIYVLRNGGIDECGTHSELMAAGGYYADLEAIQGDQDRDRAHRNALLQGLGLSTEAPADE